MRTSIGIVGAGLAGAALARGLALHGIEAEGLEQRAANAELGAGLLLTPNALAALDALGAGDAVRAAGRPVAAVRYADLADATLFRLPVGPNFVSIHRAALRHALLSHPPAPSVRFGVSVESIEAAAERVRVRCSDGTERAYDVLVGADGASSRVRQLVFDAAAPASIAGLRGWRFVARSGYGPAEPTWYLGNGRTLLLHPLPGGEVYCGAGPVDESLLASGDEDLGALRKVFDGLRGAPRDFLDALDPKTRPFPTRYWDVVQAPWRRGRCVLIGDAAHACAPTLAQGAALAFEDAVVLAETLAGGHEIEAALAAFEAARRPRVEAVQRASRERIEANRVQSDHALRVRERVLRSVGAERLAAAWAPFLAWRPDAAETRP